MMSNDPLQKELSPEACHVIAEILIGVSVGFGIWGIRNMLEGYGEDIPAAREAGERQIKTGASLAVLAACIDKGTLPSPEIMNFLISW